MDFHTWLHAELIALLRQYCPACAQRQLTLLGWMLAGLLLATAIPRCTSFAMIYR